MTRLAKKAESVRLLRGQGTPRLLPAAPARRKGDWVHQLRGLLLAAQQPPHRLGADQLRPPRVSASGSEAHDLRSVHQT